jgi:hypothetical protein
VQAGTRIAVRMFVGSMLLVAATGCPVGPTGPSAEGVALQVINNSSEEIVCLYVSPQGNDSWGADVLGDANTIPPGEAFTVRVQPGVYDLMVESIPNPPPARLQCPTGSEIGRRMGVTMNEDSQWVLYPE